METTKTATQAQTLKEIAAKYNLYMVEDMPHTHKEIEAELLAHRIKCGHKEIPQFLQTLSGYSVGLFYECAAQDKGTDKEIHYIEHSYILLLKEGENIPLMLMADRHGKYTFHPYYNTLYKFHNISHYIKNEALKGLAEPNQIGVFTEKKVSDWVNYCKEYCTRLENTLTTVNEKNVAIEKKIADFIASVPETQRQVQSHHNKTWVTLPLFEVIFEHFKDQNFCSEKIQYTGGLANVTKITNLLNS